MWNIKDIPFKLESCSYDELLESGMPEGLSEFLIGKVITYLKHDLDIFKSGRNTKKFFKIISVDFKPTIYDDSSQWTIKGVPCSNIGIIDAKSETKDFGLDFFIKNVVSGKITIIECHKKEGGLVSLKRRLDKQKSVYESLSAKLRRMRGRIKDLEEKIKNYKDDI